MRKFRTQCAETFRLRQMCNCVICSQPCQSNAESAGMPRLETLVTRPDASNHLSHVTLVFRITLRSSVSKHLRFGISTPCRNVSFASAIPTDTSIKHFPYLTCMLCTRFWKRDSLAEKMMQLGSALKLIQWRHHFYGQTKH